MKIVITGANGMVGRAVSTFCRGLKDDVVALPREELDISNTAECLRLIAAEEPHAVLNCAAYTDVDGAETNESAAMQLND